MQGNERIDVGLWQVPPGTGFSYYMQLHRAYPVLSSLESEGIFLANYVSTPQGDFVTFDVGRMRYYHNLVNGKYDDTYPNEKAEGVARSVFTNMGARKETVDAVYQYAEAIDKDNAWNIVLGWLSVPEHMPAPIKKMLAEDPYINPEHHRAAAQAPLSEFEMHHTTGVASSGVQESVRILERKVNDVNIEGLMYEAEPYLITLDTARKLASKINNVKDKIKKFVELRTIQARMFRSLHNKAMRTYYSNMAAALERAAQQGTDAEALLVAINGAITDAANAMLRASRAVSQDVDNAAKLKQLYEAYMMSFELKHFADILAAHSVSEEVREAVRFINGNVEQIQSLFKEHGKAVLTDIIFDALGHLAAFDTKEKISDLIDNYEGSVWNLFDIIPLFLGGGNFMTNTFVRMLHTTMTDSYAEVKEQVNAFNEAISKMDLGPWIFERDADGKRTGWLNGPVSWSRWQKARRQVFEDFIKRNNLPFEPEELFEFFATFDFDLVKEKLGINDVDQALDRWTQLREEYIDDLIVFHENNSVFSKEATDYIIKRLRDIEAEWDVDLSDIIDDTKNGRTPLTKMSAAQLRVKYPTVWHALLDLRQSIAAGDSVGIYGKYEPNPAVYANPDWQLLTKEQQDAIIFLAEQRQQADTTLPYGYGHAWAIPNVKKRTFIRQVLGHTSEEMVEAAQEGQIIEDPNGNKILAPPIYYTKVPDKAEELSDDPVHIYTAYMHMALHHHMMIDLRHSVEAFSLGLKTSKPESSKLVNYTNLYRRFVMQPFIAWLRKSILYDLSITPLPKKLGFIDKMMDILSQLTFLRAFVFQPVGALVVGTTGFGMSFLEALRGERLNVKGLFTATFIYGLRLPELILDSFRRYPRTKVGVYLRMSDAFNDYRERLYRDPRFLREAGHDVMSLFTMLRHIDHFITATFALGVGLSTKARYNGKEQSVFSLMQSDGTFPPGAVFAKTGKPLTKATWSAYMLRSYSRVHAARGQGHHAVLSQNKIARYLFLMFKSWVVPTFSRVLGTRVEDMDTGEVRSSYAAATVRLLTARKQLARGDKRALTEMVVLIMLLYGLKELLRRKEERSRYRHYTNWDTMDQINYAVMLRTYNEMNLFSQVKDLPGTYLNDRAFGTLKSLYKMGTQSVEIDDGIYLRKMKNQDETVLKHYAKRIIGLDRVFKPEDPMNIEGTIRYYSHSR
ncbi:MAG: hypothetical protein D6746_08585 [Bacteroidetes bacterium]|nr:MAG: hypothetical protein D6746_08585 [Bacteroidota bacterium]